MGDQGNANAKNEVLKDREQSEGASALPDVSTQSKTEPESCEKRLQGGGWVTTPFIFGCEAAEALAGSGSRVNLITFLTAVMHMENLTAATLLNTFSSFTTVTGLMGAYVADAYLGRFSTIFLGSWIQLSGLITLTVVASNKSLHPATCQKANFNAGTCDRASSLQMGVLYFAFSLMAIGSGALRPCVAPFGASQFNQSHPEEMKQLKHYFNWYFFSVTVAALLGTTIIVYIQDNVGWPLGFGIPAIIVLVSIIIFIGGIRLYRYSPPRGSPFTRMARVIVAAIRKRGLVLPDDPSKLYQGATKEEVDESEELENPSSDDECNAHVPKQKLDPVDFKLILQKRAPAEGGQTTVAGASVRDENLDKATVQSDKLRVQKDADVPHLKKIADDSDVKEVFANEYHEKNDMGKLQLQLPREALIVGPRQGGAKDDVIVLRHSDQFGFLDKAAIEIDQDWITVVGRKSQISKTRINPWRLCTVQQVEELKCMVRLAPMWATVIPLTVAMSQGHTYIIQQASTMDRRLGSFVIPAASLSVISTITILIWLPFYDKIMIPFLRKHTGKERGITFLQKIGVGNLLLILGELVKALVEHKRRKAAAHYGLVNKPHDTIPISAFWLLPQFVIGGLSESFLMVGHMEFFYYMLPEHMTSTGTALFFTATAIGASLSTVFLHVIETLTKRRGHPGWLDNNINKAHLDYFYGLTTAWLVADFAFFLVVASWYKRQRHLNQLMGRSS